MPEGDFQNVIVNFLQSIMFTKPHLDDTPI